ncbi:MAG TPA: selenide, water dikinase SelD [Saprospiraceae bacterium]|nr:selenide, water dikinase SelD [Saprospiraceae bacterium]
MNVNHKEEIKLTQYSHGAGCGCKISPEVLDCILGQVSDKTLRYSSLLVGNAQRDDAAVMDLGDGTAIISTTDFFMPIVDDPETFGRIAATNAISDIYAMGGTPLMAVAILGWPVNVLSPEIAGRVVNGAQMTCTDAGIPLAGGHSIDSPEPIFGLAVTGRIDIRNIKKNGGAAPGDLLFLTKPLGIGVLTTAEKKGMIKPIHAELAVKVMTQLNHVGERLGKIAGVTAMTDITGFGLAGHLLEMCQASDTSATIRYDDLPIIDPSVETYILQGCIPGGTNRNYDSYGSQLQLATDKQRFILCDPQTSGGLLIAVSPEFKEEVQDVLEKEGLWSGTIGIMTEPQKWGILVS